MNRGTPSTLRPPVGPVLFLIIVLALSTVLVSPMAGAQTQIRVGDAADPVVAAVRLNQEKAQAPGYAGPSQVAVIGRSDVFADNLAATALAGRDGVLLLTDGGSTAPLRDEVLTELRRTMAPGTCDGDGGPTVFLAGGTQAVSQAVEDELASTRFCVRRLAGPTRLETAITVAEAVADPSDTVLLARSDEWADAAAVGSYAAATQSRVLVTPGAELTPVVAEALRRMAPERIVLLGGVDALSPAVAIAAADIAPTRRVAGPARDATAVAIATELWAGRSGGDVALADGYEDTAWTYLFAGAAIAALRDMPILYTAEGQPTAVIQAYLDGNPPALIMFMGPGPTLEPPPDLDAADVTLELVANLEAPLMLKARPGVPELWVAQREGQIVALSATGQREVLDISATVGTTGEGGLLGLAFEPSGDVLYTSSTDIEGTSVVDAFDIVGDRVDPGTRRQVITVAQPATNHNGGDLQRGPDGSLWWALGDGGGSGDTFGNGQDPGTLLGTLVRIDPQNDGGYAVPLDNPFVDGGGAPEVWAYGLRNPFRFDFDEVTGDLYVADVGQQVAEEIDYFPGGTGAGANLGWPIFEGTQRFQPGTAPGHMPPVFEEFHSDGNCSLTGGVVYRGNAIPELDGAYLYSDFCRDSLRAVLVTDGTVSQAADLGIRVERPVGFGTGHDGEAYVLSIRGEVLKLVPA